MQQSKDQVGTISLKTLLMEQRYLKPFVIAMTLMLLQQFSGVNAVMFYTQTIFEKAGSKLDPGEVNVHMLDVRLNAVVN